MLKFPLLSKVLAKVGLAFDCGQIERNEIFQTFQSGFQAFLSTDTALFKVTNDLHLLKDIDG